MLLTQLYVLHTVYAYTITMCIGSCMLSFSVNGYQQGIEFVGEPVLVTEGKISHMRISQQTFNNVSLDESSYLACRGFYIPQRKFRGVYRSEHVCRSVGLSGRLSVGRSVSAL